MLEKSDKIIFSPVSSAVSLYPFPVQRKTSTFAFPTFICLVDDDSSLV